MPEPLIVAAAYNVSGASNGPSGLMMISRGPTILSTVHTRCLPANDTTTPGRRSLPAPWPSIASSRSTGSDSWRTSVVCAPGSTSVVSTTWTAGIA